MCIALVHTFHDGQLPTVLVQPIDQVHLRLREHISTLETGQVPSDGGLTWKTYQSLKLLSILVLILCYQSVGCIPVVKQIIEQQTGGVRYVQVA
jgi:hypothetical protein